jgi:hypothetical protein
VYPASGYIDAESAGTARPRLALRTGATILSIGGTPTARAARAAIVYSGPLNLAVPVGTSSNRIWIDITTFTTSTTGSFTGWDIALWGSDPRFLTVNSASLSNNRFIGTGTGTPTPIARLEPGSVIGSTSTFGTNGGGSLVMPTYSPAPGPILPNSENIVGFRHVVGTQTLFGWMSINVGSDMLTRTITGIAYEDSGASIQAGAIPAPGAVALLGLGGAFAGRGRRRTR